MNTIIKILLLLLIAGGGIYYAFNYVPEVEAYKPLNSIIAKGNVPTIVNNGETFKINITLSYTFGYNIPIEQVEQYIAEYGESYIIGGKEIQLQRYLGTVWTENFRVATTNDLGQAEFSLSLSEDTILRIYFKGSTWLKSLTGEQFSITVSGTPPPDKGILDVQCYVDSVKTSPDNNEMVVDSTTYYTDGEGHWSGEFDPATYTITATYNAEEKTDTAIIIDGQTTYIILSWGTEPPVGYVDVILSTDVLTMIEGETKTMTLTFTPMNEFVGDVTVTYNTLSGLTITANILIGAPISVGTGFVATFTITGSTVATYNIAFTIKPTDIAQFQKQLTVIVQASTLYAFIDSDKTTYSPGEMATVMAHVTGGLAPYTYDWYVDGSYVSTTSLYKYEFTSSSEGIYEIYCIVEDSDYHMYTTDAITLTYTTQELASLYLTVYSRLDINKDLFINQNDVDIVIEYLGSDASIHPECDINEDREIDLYDASTILKYMFNEYLEVQVVVDGQSNNIIMNSASVLVGEYIIGLHDIQVTILVTSEESTQIVNISENPYYYTPTFSNPWKSVSLGAFVLTGNVVIDSTRILGLIIAGICIVLIAYLFIKKQKK